MSEDLRGALDRLPAEIRDELERNGFDRERFMRLAKRVASGEAIDNRVTGRVEPPAPEDVSELPPVGSKERAELEQAGLAALARGEVALAVLAGGMATRMGGVVKALVDAIPGHSFLDLRIREVERLGAQVGRPVPLWLMTSSATEQPIRDALGERLDGEKFATFPQTISLRLTPQGDLFLDEHAKPSDYPTGHGDFPDALRRASLISRFVDRGGRLVMLANIDNLGATVDPVIVGFHLAHGKPVTCEVADKFADDRGGIPVRLDGRPVVLEEFRLPVGFDPTKVRVFNTNTFHFEAKTLRDLAIDWTFFLVQKKVGTASVVQFERLIGEVTSHLDTRFLRLPREGAESRFLPVKDNDELALRRPVIEQVAKARGIL